MDYPSAEVINAPLVADQKITQRLYAQAESAGEIRKFSRLHPLQAYWKLAMEWGIILSMWIWTAHSPSGTVWVLAFVVVSTRQLAVTVFFHDGTHFRLHPKTSINDWISDFFCAFPFLLSTELYRKSHFVHHRYTGTDQDPDMVGMALSADWVYPKTAKNFLKVLLRDLSGYTFFADLKWGPFWRHWSPIPKLIETSGNVKLSGASKKRFILFSLLALSSLAAVGGWTQIFWLWILPQITLTKVLFRFQGIAEHIVVENSGELDNTRTIVPRFWEKFIFGFHHSNYHLEHHLFPAVPSYNLKKLHRFLVATLPDYSKNAHITYGYFDKKNGLLAEIIKN